MTTPAVIPVPVRGEPATETATAPASELAAATLPPRRPVSLGRIPAYAQGTAHAHGPAIAHNPAYAHRPTGFVQRACECGCGCDDDAQLAAADVDPVDDPLEREADRVATEIAGLAPSAGGGAAGGLPSPGLSEGGADDSPPRDVGVQGEPDIVQAKASGGVGAAQRTQLGELGARLRSARTGGQPMPAAERGFFEPRFGVNFEHVRFHTDPQADALSHALHARAFTTGGDVFFREGQYRPDSADGRSLIAHELTHVVQQAGGSTRRKSFADRVDDVIPRWARGPAGPPAADAATTATAAVQPASDIGADGLTPANMIQRQPDPRAPASRKIKKIILDKTRMVAVYVLEGHGREQAGVLDHCDPAPGTYTAVPLPGSPLQWRTDKNVGCTAGKDYIHKLARADFEKFTGTFDGVESFEFEVVGDRPRTVDDVWKDILSLPEDVREFLTTRKDFRPSRSGLTMTLEQYEAVLRVGRRLVAAGVTGDELYGYKREARIGRDVTAFEASIERFLDERAARREAREENVEVERRTAVDLHGHDDLFEKWVEYKWMSRLVGPRVSAKMREELEGHFSNSGFPGGIPAFEEAVGAYESAFKKETLALAFDLLRRYRHLLAREASQFQYGMLEEATRLHHGLGSVKESAQDLYGQAKTLQREAQRLQANLDIRRYESAWFKPLTGVVSIEPEAGDKAEQAEIKAKLEEARDLTENANAIVADAAGGHTVVGWQDFPREKILRAKSPVDVKYQMTLYVAGHINAVDRATKLLEEKPDRIYMLDNLLEYSYKAQSIEKDSMQDRIVRRRKDQIKKDEQLKNFLLAVLGIAFAVLTLGGGTLGLIAVGAGFVLSVYELYDAFQDYDVKTQLYLAQLLSESPSAAGLVLAIVSVGLDAGDVVKAVEGLKAVKAFDRIDDLEKLDEVLEKGLKDKGFDDRIVHAVREEVDAQRRVAAATERLAPPTGVKIVLDPLAGPIDETVSKLSALAYHHLKRRKGHFTYPEFLGVLREEGLIGDVAKLAAPERAALEAAYKKAYKKALDDIASKRTVYGEAVYEMLSERTRAVLRVDDVDALAAQGRALGRSDDEIVRALDSTAPDKGVADVIGRAAKEAPKNLDRATEEWLARLHPDTRKALADPKNAASMEAFRTMDPEVRRALTMCGSSCIPIPPPPDAQVKQIRDFMDEAKVQSDDQGLREYLHDMRDRGEYEQAADALSECKTLEDAQRVFDTAIARWAGDLGGTATKVGDRWQFKRADGTVVKEWETKEYGSLAVTKGTRSYFQAHHGIQKAWAKGRSIPGYSDKECPAILLRDSYAGSPHRQITDRQNAMLDSDWTYFQERKLMIEDLEKRAKVPQPYADDLINQSDEYFGKLYTAWRDKLRTEDSSPAEIDATLEKVFGEWKPE